MNIMNYVQQYAEQIGGQFTDYDHSKSVVVVPLNGSRYQTVLAITQTSAVSGRDQAVFTSKVCEFAPNIDLKNLLEQNANFDFSKFVLEAVRQGGFDAEKRVQRILAQRGVAGVLAEINLISGDYAQRHYYEALIKQANLNATALRDVLRQAARDISSDYEQAQLLIGVAPMVTGKDAAIQPFFDAVATIKSDYERGRVLKTIMKQDTNSSAVLVLVASSTQTISSDYERRGVLSALVKTKNQSEEVLRLLLDSAAAMSSDYEKATLLMEVSNAYTGDTRLKGLFLKAVETIKSDYERGRVLSALLKNKQIG